MPLVAIGCIFGQSQTLFAQRYQVLPLKKDGVRRAPAVAKPAKPVDTELNVEIFSGKEGVGLYAQQWQTTFAQEAVNLRIRQGVPGDKVGIEQKQYGKLRMITITGKIDRDGSLTFPGKRFSTTDSVALIEWLREVQVYGAQGNPTGQPLWGLDEAQFGSVYKPLSGTVERDPEGGGLSREVGAIGVPNTLPIKYSADAGNPADNTTALKPGQAVKLKGCTKGSALAIVLSQYELGFRPLRTPEGAIELSCVPLAGGAQVWPIGWDAPAGTSPAKLAPTLYEDTIVELHDRSVLQALDQVESSTGVPIHFDWATINSRKNRLADQRVNIDNRHMAPWALVQRVCSPALLLPKLRFDEAQRPFIWVTAMAKGLPSDARPAVKR